MLWQRNKHKYVNMADIISDACDRAADESGRERAFEPVSGAAAPAEQDDLYWFIEALFFAYRDFISDPDRILNEIGFGRAHHRVLHFIHRYPGMRVADLLEILQITKQSLARVLRELVKEGYVAQRSGKDRRERLLYATAKGRILARRLAAPQLDKIRDALAQFGAEGQAAVARFLDAMISGAAGQPNAIRTRAVGFGDDRPMGDR